MKTEMWQDRDNIVGKPIAKTLRRLTVPAVLSTFFTVIFEIIDMFWIGKLGAVSIAALSASSFYVWMLRGLGLIVATGTIALVSRRSGEKDEKGILTAITNAGAPSRTAYSPNKINLPGAFASIFMLILDYFCSGS